MSLTLPNSKKTKSTRFVKNLIVPSLLLSTIVPTAYADTHVSVSSNTGTNTVNGVTTTNTGTTKIIINGKEYVNDNTGGSHDISDDSNGGHVEVHVNSANSRQQTGAAVHGSTITPAPTIDVKPTIEKRKEEIKQQIVKKKEEHEQQQKTMADQLQQTLQTLVAGFNSIFRVFSGK